MSQLMVAQHFVEMWKSTLSSWIGLVDICAQTVRSQGKRRCARANLLRLLLCSCPAARRFFEKTAVREDASLLTGYLRRTYPLPETYLPDIRRRQRRGVPADPREDEWPQTAATGLRPS